MTWGTQNFRFGGDHSVCSRREPSGVRHRSHRRGRIPVAVIPYTAKHRIWVRDVLVGIAASLGSNLMWSLAQTVVHRLG